MLDGGGARLADAATRHHLTHTRGKRKHGEQNKHQGTQTIQKTSTRKSTSHGHHTLPSMRSQTPIHKQRTTQTQQRRSRPHNPSITRRIQPPRQRTSPLRQMQQPTRQRQTRKRQSTPLPEKRGRKRQTTRSRHANTTLRHMVNPPPPFHNNRKGGERGKAGSRERRREHNKGDAMVFGDNVRARRAARALPRTPTIRRKRKRREDEPHPPPFHTPQHNTTRQNKTCTVVTTRWYADSIPYPLSPIRLSTQHKPSPLFPNNTILSQRHTPKPTML